MSVDNRVYVKPRLGCSCNLFLMDSTKRHVPWPKVQQGKDANLKPGTLRWGRINGALSDGYYTLRVTQSPQTGCRDGFIANFREMLGKLTPPNHKVALTPPPHLAKRTPVLTSALLEFSISRSGEGTYTSDMPSFLAMKDRLTLLVGSEEGQRQVFKLMDVFLGPLAMLLAGPSGYSKVKPHPIKALPAVMTKENYYKSETRKTAVREINNAKMVLQYGSLSNFFIVHPATMSLVVGLARFALESWLDNQYDKIAKTTNINKTFWHLSLLRKKKELSQEDKKWLLQKLFTIQDKFLSGEKIRSNPGAYPINPFTWSLFQRYLERDTDPDIVNEWTKKLVFGEVYERPQRGFYDWCVLQPNRPSVFIPSSRTWNGNQGSEFTT